MSISPSAGMRRCKTTGSDQSWSGAARRRRPELTPAMAREIRELGNAMAHNEENQFLSTSYDSRWLTHDTVSI